MNHNSDSDSDSDSDSSSQQTHAQYTLGFDDGKIGKPEEAEQYSTSRIGGRPALLPLSNTAIPESDLECLVCQKPIAMLVQVYCPSDQNPYHDRILYLFGCADQQCQAQGSSRCVRGFKSWKFNEEYHRQSSAQQTRSSHPQSALDCKLSDLGDNPFKMNAPNLFDQSFDNPFSAPTPTHTHRPTPDPSPPVNPFSNLTLEPTETTPTKSSAQEHNLRLVASLPALCTPPHYLATDYELKPKLSSSSTFKELIDDHQPPPPSSSTSKNAQQKPPPNKQKSSARSAPSASIPPANAQESYEVQAVKGVDPAFLDFQDRINWSSQSTQIIRYNPKGRALPVHSSKPTPSIVSLRCGHRSRFELQFMPAGLRLFSAPIDWTTVWINDCVQDCCSPHPSSPASLQEGWTEIQCFVQSVVD
ncbi:hypothetical protein PTTG_07063 [Puccinia triticina 1-1 BBBD Race 1]|uniref:PDCD2_C domain-containing protein n=1 Tax=Puccinia triticina (isolate 1-1 / race 1 (BBBD)) TaxID=630390 RepID=A0A180G7P6_PUCT1|nr:hypothetical protein PTTG_07063 [Puccinia triticina 1-1 BBBD Race 1]